MEISYYSYRIELIEELKNLFDDRVTSVIIKINCETTKMTCYQRDPEQLKKSDYSMRNIKGNFIKDVQK